MSRDRFLYSEVVPKKAELTQEKSGDVDIRVVSPRAILKKEKSSAQKLLS